MLPLLQYQTTELANKAQKVLKREREEHKEIEDKFQELRADFVSGRNEMKYEGEIDTEMIIESKKKAYKDKFVEGQFVENMGVRTGANAERRDRWRAHRFYPRQV